MTTYYVGPGGNNGSAGTSYATRWLTITKAVGATGIASGDTVYIAPGTYRETVTVAMTSAVAETFVIGDTDGSHTSGVQGPVIVTAYTTNDTTAPSSTATLVLAGRDFLTFRNITWVGGTSSPQLLDASTATSTNITFTDCGFLASSAFNVSSMTIAVGADVNAAWLFDRCAMFCKGILITLATSASADYDANIMFRNSYIHIMAVAIDVAASGANSFKGGGVDVLNCTLLGSSPVFRTATNCSTSIPCTVNNSIVVASGTALSAATSGQITESYNLIMANTPRTNVTAGTGSNSNGAYAPMLHANTVQAGAIRRGYLEPMAGSPLLGFGTGASPPSVDFLNRVRPSGGALTMAAGAIERHEYGTKETGTVDTGGLAVRLTGPRDHQFILPVTNAVSRTVTLKVYYDTNHATTNPPQATLVANNAIGYAGETVTAAASTGSFLTLTFAAFTPTATGYVILRVTSRAAAGNGFAIFDSVVVT